MRRKGRLIGMFLPLPLLVMSFALWLGYRSCDHDDGFGLIFAGPMLLFILLVLAGASVIALTLSSPPGWKMPVAGIHLTFLVLTV